MRSWLSVPLLSFAPALLALPGVLCGAACKAPNVSDDFAPLGPVHGLTGVPAEYYPSFEALRMAVDAHEDATARMVLERVVSLMEADRELLWEDMTRDERRGLESAFALAQGFERILDGRDRVSSLSLALEVQQRDGQHELTLVVDSTWPADLSLRPGPASLREVIVWVTPVGRENRIVRHLAIDELQELAVPGGGSTQLAITRTPYRLPPEALAASWSWVLQLRSGGVVDADGRYPAMGWPQPRASKTELATYLPRSAVEPFELAEYIEARDVTLGPVERVLPPILERAVRIPEGQRGEALALLRPLVERGTPEEIERMVPALRWLSRASSPGGDPLAWRQWMRVHAERAAEGAETAVTGVDLPRNPVR